MKLNKSYILALGVLGSPLLTTNSNAQTFYQCMPITCSDGQYINGNKCENCPAGTYQKGNKQATSCTPCSAGSYSYEGASSCTTCEAGYSCNNGKRTSCPSGQYQNATGQSSCKACDSSKTIRVDVYRRCISNTAANGGGCSAYVTKNQDLKLNLGNNTFEQIHNNNTFKYDSTSVNTDTAIGDYKTPYNYNFLSLTINGSFYLDVTSINYTCNRVGGDATIQLNQKDKGPVFIK